MFSDSIKKMAMSQFSNYMKQNNISEVCLCPNEAGELQLKEAVNPDKFILHSEHEKALHEQKEKLRVAYMELVEKYNFIVTQYNELEQKYNSLNN